MKGLIRKVASYALILTMGVALLGGCSSKKDSSANKTPAATDTKSTEPVNLRIFFGDVKKPDDDLVAKAVSEVTKKMINATVEFVMFGPGEYNQKIPLLLASNEKMDIGFDAGWIDYVGRAKSGAYLDLTKLLKTTPKLYNTIDPLLWQGATIDGGIYGVPAYKELAEQWALYAETDFLKQNNIDTTKIKKLADAEVILQALKKDPKRAGFMVSAAGFGGGSSLSVISLDLMQKYDVIQDAFVVDKSEGKTVLNYFMSKEYEDYTKLMRDWFKKGYIAPDVATRENYDQYIKNGNYNFGLGLVSYSPLNEVGQSKNYGKDLTPIKITPVTTTNGSTRGSLNCIYAKSQNPEKAIQFLELLNTVPEIKNLTTYGIEGKHYNLVGGKVEPVKNINDLYINQSWRNGNMFIGNLMVGEPDDKYKQYLDFNKQAKASVVLGFTPDTKAMTDKIAAVNNAFKEYGILLSLGAVDPDEYLPRFRNALKAAGVDTVIAEMQKQYNDWKAKQK